MIFDPELGIGEGARGALVGVGTLAALDIRLERRAEVGQRLVEVRIMLVYV
jgi:hypothetical protein